MPSALSRTVYLLEDDEAFSLNVGRDENREIYKSLGPWQNVRNAKRGKLFFIH